MSPEHDPASAPDASSDGAPSEPPTGARKEAWPVVAPVDGMPRWLAWLILLALLASAVAATRFVLTPPRPAPPPAPSAPEPAGGPAR